MKYSDEQRLRKIYDYAAKLCDYIKQHNITKGNLMSDYTLQWLVTTPLYNIGEQAYSLSKEYKELHNDIPWSMISGLRHRLVHDYDGTNWNIIADVIIDELPTLLKQIEKLSK